MSGVEVDDEELQLEISKLKQVLATAAPPPQPEYYELDSYSHDGAASGSQQALTDSSDPRQQLLNANLQFQSVLRAQLRAIEAAQQLNLFLQKRMRTLVTAATKAAKPAKATRSLASALLFPDDPVKAEEALENDDVKKKRARQQMVPLHHKFKRWTKAELDGLAKGVRQQNQQILLDKLMAEYQSENKDLEGFNKEMEAISALGDEELEKNVVGIEWDTLAKAYVPTRTGNDCRIQWVNSSAHVINNSPWTKQEDKQLLTLAKEHKAFDWQKVATDLGTNRTAWQCFRRYQRSLNNNMMKSKWTPEEDELLKKAVKECGDKNWQQVAVHLDGRTGQQCLHRWQKTLNPSIRRGRWNHEEDKRLILAYKAYEGRSWILVQPHLQGRTDVQCRERWCNVLDPSINSGSWTPEEDAKLRAATEEFGLGKWASVAQRVGTRTDNQCWRRWKVLNQDAVLPYRQAVFKKRKGGGRHKDSNEDAAEEEDGEDEEVPPPVKKRSGKRKTVNGGAADGDPTVPAAAAKPAAKSRRQSAREKEKEKEKEKISTPDDTLTNFVYSRPAVQFDRAEVEAAAVRALAIMALVRPAEDSAHRALSIGYYARETHSTPNSVSAVPGAKRCLTSRVTPLSGEQIALHDATGGCSLRGS